MKEAIKYLKYKFLIRKRLAFVWVFLFYGIFNFRDQGASDILFYIFIIFTMMEYEYKKRKKAPEELLPVTKNTKHIANTLYFVICLAIAEVLKSVAEFDKFIWWMFGIYFIINYDLILERLKIKKSKDEVKKWMQK